MGHCRSDCSAVPLSYLPKAAPRPYSRAGYLMGVPASGFQVAVEHLIVAIGELVPGEVQRAIACQRYGGMARATRARETRSALLQVAPLSWEAVVQAFSKSAAGRQKASCRVLPARASRRPNP